jgi:hypothetical protein
MLSHPLNGGKALFVAVKVPMYHVSWILSEFLLFFLVCQLNCLHITTVIVHQFLPDSESCYAGFIGCRCTVKETTN